MKNLIESPPRTMMEVFKSLPEGTLVELIDNVLYMSPSPSYKHQQTSKIIFKQLVRAVEDTAIGQVFYAPLDVYLDENENVVQPDLFVVLNNNRGIIHEDGYVHGCPDLVVEIISPGNKDHDTVIKKNLFERFKVREFWLIDPSTKQARVFLFSNGKYQLVSEDIGVVKSQILGTTFPF